MGLETLLGKEFYAEVTAVVPLKELTEVRLRVNMPVVVRNGAARFYLRKNATDALIEGILGRATNHSMYAYQEELASGYIHYAGGIRVGVAGRGVCHEGRLAAFKDITSLNIRVPHEILGCSDPLADIMKDFENTLIIAPPFAGKTTLIRDMARVLSARYDVTIVDEREEIAGRGGVYRLGALCDVVAGVPKSLAYEGVIRALSPEIIVLDEIFPARDLDAVEDISRSGIRFLASLHGGNIEEFVARHPALSRLFRYGVLLGYKPKVGSIQSIVRFSR